MVGSCSILALKQDIRAIKKNKVLRFKTFSAHPLLTSTEMGSIEVRKWSTVNHDVCKFWDNLLMNWGISIHGFWCYLDMDKTPVASVQYLYGFEWQK